MLLRGLMIAAVLLLILAGGVRAEGADGGRGTTWYVHGEMGSDANVGTSPQSPVRSFAPIAHLVDSGQRVCIAGRVHAGHFGDMLSLENKTDIVIEQWKGQPQAWLIGYVPVTSDAWHNIEGSGAWRATIAAGLPIDHIVNRYFSRVTESGRFYGFMKREPVTATLQGSGPQGRWTYEPTTGVLTIHTLGSGAPGEHIGYWVGGGRNAIRLVECERVTVRGLKFACWPSWSQGQAVRRINCRDTLVEDCEAHDCGSHSFSDEGRSVPRPNNRSRNLRALGWNPAGTAYVTHSFVVNIEEGDWEACSFVAGRCLGEDGQTLQGMPPNGQIGFYAHTSNGGYVTAGGVRLIGCQGWEDEPIAAAISVDNGVLPMDSGSFDQYPLQSIDCTFRIAGRLLWATQNGRGASAFRRCRMHFLTGTSYGFGSWHGLIHEAFDNPHLWEYCEIIGDTSNPSALVGMTFSGTAGVEFRFKRCTMIDRSVSANPKTWFNYAFMDSRVRAEGCIIAFANTNVPTSNRGNWNDPAVPAANHAFDGNLYVNWDLDRCSQNDGFGTQALWTAVIDPEAVFLPGSASVLFPLLQPGGNGEPSGELDQSSPIWTLRRPDWVGVSVLSGLNGRPDSGHYGSYQYGQLCYANCDGSTGVPVLTANDFQCFLNRFAAADPYANCDGSTGSPALTANDFQCFLNAFAAGCNR